MGLRTGLLAGLHRMACGIESVVMSVTSVTSVSVTSVTSVPVSVPPIVVSVPMVIELITAPPAMQRQA